MVTARWCPWVASHSHSNHKRQIVIHTPYITIVQSSISRVKPVMDLYCCWLSSCCKCPKFHLSLVLASVVQDDADTCNINPNLFLSFYFFISMQLHFLFFGVLFLAFYCIYSISWFESQKYTNKPTLHLCNPRTAQP